MVGSSGTANLTSKNSYIIHLPAPINQIPHEINDTNIQIAINKSIKHPHPFLTVSPKLLPPNNAPTIIATIKRDTSISMS